MKWLGWVLCLTIWSACGNRAQEDTTESEGAEFNYENFSKRFTASKVPYSITDTALLKNKDTAGIRNVTFSAYIPDSVKTKLVGKSTKVKYVPIARLEVPKAETYFVIKAESGNRKAALLAVFGKDKKFSTAFPFLVPDNEDNTSQTSIIDKSYTVSRNISQKGKDDVVTEGKDVFAYNDAAKDFTLIMTDMLDDGTGELINPIDTFPKLNKLSGDYLKGKRGIVSIRDGRNPSELVAFVHFEKEDGECTGELKGNLLMTSSTTAVYRQGGDPCVLEFTFSGASVSLKEVEGCGSHRDLKCIFDDRFTRKKEPVAKSSKTKKSKK